MKNIKNIYVLCREFGYRIRDDFVSAFSAQTAFFLFLSFFPFAMFLLTLVNYLPFTAEEMSAIIIDAFPSSVAPFVQSVLEELLLKASGAFLSITVIVTLWSASMGFLALTRGMNCVYNHRETRNYFLLRLISYIYTIIFSLLLILTIVIFVLGNQFYNLIISRFPQLNTFVTSIINLRTVIGMLIMTFFFWVMYCALPNRKPKIIRELPGAIFASVGWVGFSFLFSFYIDNMGSYSKTYGSLAAFIICMLWLYVCIYILFIGAEFNSVLSDPDFKKYYAFLIPKKKGKAVADENDENEDSTDEGPSDENFSDDES